MNDMTLVLLELVSGPNRIEALLSVELAGTEASDIVVAGGDTLPGPLEVVAVERGGSGRYADDSVAVRFRGIEMRIAVGGRLVRRGSLWCMEKGRARTVAEASRQERQQAHQAMQEQLAGASGARFFAA